MYIDAFYHPLRLAFESDGYVPHAERITRDRFSFERMRMRTIAAFYGFKYIPFSWDELNKQSEICRRTVYAILGRYTSSNDRAILELTVYEREVIRYALRLNRPFRLADVRYCLQLGEVAGRKVLKQLMVEGFIRPVGKGKEKIRLYELTGTAYDYML